MRACCFLKFSVVALILLTVSESKFCQRFIKLIRFSDIACDHCGVSRFGVRQRESPATQATVCFHPFGAGSLWVKLIAALHVAKLPNVEFDAVDDPPT